MKAKHTLLVAGLVIFSLASCKKDDTTPADTTAEREATVQASKDQSNTDYLMEDAGRLMDDAVESQNLMGGRADAPSTSNITSCATVTVTPASGFPRTITIDFGVTGCMSLPDSIFRRGKIIIVITDSLRNPGSVATMTFDNYYVQGFHKEGTIIWTNTTVPPLRSWSREVVDGKITAPGGVRYWLHEGIRNVTQIEGNGTPHLLFDDEFTITGNSTVTNANNVTRTATIVNTLHKRAACRWIHEGTVRFQGPNHTALLDYGHNGCNPFATISVDGGAPQPITLP